MKFKGFTLIELLVVIAIIAMLASIILASLGSARAKARDAQRLSELHQMQTALELYASNNQGQYPTVANWSTASTNCAGLIQNQGLSGANGYIPNLATAYMPSLPLDPSGTGVCGYIYYSNPGSPIGPGYIILSYHSMETGNYTRCPANCPANTWCADHWPASNEANTAYIASDSNWACEGWSP